MSDKPEIPPPDEGEETSAQPAQRVPVYYWVIGALAIVLMGWLALKNFKPMSPADGLTEVFADLSLGAPDYKDLHYFRRPAETIKDIFEADFSQTESQLQELAKKMDVSVDEFRSQNGAKRTAQAKSNPNLPWELVVIARLTNTTEQIYRVHISGRRSN